MWKDTQSAKGGGGEIDSRHLYIKPNTTATVHILLKQGEEPISYWTHYVNGKNIICPGRGVCPVCKDGSYKSRKRHSINVWDYATKAVMILEQGNQVMQQLRLILDQYKSFDTIDIAIRRMGEGRDTQYMATPVPAQGFVFTPEMEKGLHAIATIKAPTQVVEIEQAMDATSFNPEPVAQAVGQAQSTVAPKEEKLAPITSIITLEFGKYKGKTLEEVAKTDIAYVKWCAQNISDFALRAEAQRIVKITVQAPEKAPEPLAKPMDLDVKTALINGVYSIINEDERYKNNFTLVVEKMKAATSSALNPNGKTLITDYTIEELEKLKGALESKIT